MAIWKGLDLCVRRREMVFFLLKFIFGIHKMNSVILHNYPEKIMNKHRGHNPRLYLDKSNHKQHYKRPR